MVTTKLIKWSGLASVLAGVLYAFAALIHPAGEDVASILMPAWVPAHILGAASAIFMLFGFVGLYARQAEKAGWVGLTGFVLVFVGSAFLMAEEFQSVVFSPIAAVKAPTLIEESTNSGSIPVFGLVFLVSFALGFILFGIATMRSGVLPRWSGLVLIMGLLLTFGGQISHGVGIIAAIVIGGSLAWMGYALWSEKPQVG